MSISNNFNQFNLYQNNHYKKQNRYNHRWGRFNRNNTAEQNRYNYNQGGFNRNNTFGQSRFNNNYGIFNNNNPGFNQMNYDFKGLFQALEKLLSSYKNFMNTQGAGQLKNNNTSQQTPLQTNPANNNAGDLNGEPSNNKDSSVFTQDKNDKGNSDTKENSATKNQRGTHSVKTAHGKTLGGYQKHFKDKTYNKLPGKNKAEPKKTDNIFKQNNDINVNTKQETSNDKTNQTTPKTTSTYNNPYANNTSAQGKSLNNGALGKNAFDNPNWKKDLNVSSSWRMHTTKVINDPSGRFNNVLRNSYKAGAVDGGSGPGFWTKIKPTDHAFLKYSVRPDENFEFVLGGKLPGLYGGKGNSGGQVAHGDDGFTTRYMWRENGQGELYPYLPTTSYSTKDQIGISNKWGAELGKGSFKFTPGKWTDLQQEVKLNTPGKADGILRVWADGKLVYEKTNTVYRTTDKLKIDGMYFCTFYGGKSEKFAPSRNTHNDFANFQISDKYIP